MFQGPRGYKAQMCVWKQYNKMAVLHIFRINSTLYYGINSTLYYGINSTLYYGIGQKDVPQIKDW